MSRSRYVDLEVADALRQMRKIARVSQTQKRSLRPGRNALRRMDTGQLVNSFRQETVDRRIRGVEDTRWDSLADEFERRDLREAADEARRNAPYPERGVETALGAVAAGIVAGAAAGSYRESDKLEEAVNDRVNELGGDELLVEQQRETEPLTATEYEQDLEEIGASEEAQEAARFSGNVNGENPAEGMIPRAEDVEAEIISGEALEEVEEAEDAAASM
ncbi:hypothetical protein NQ042_12610 [Corynebacterium phoceense]|uniref:hypothetical protein n=1 Tax=Corynebacterium phoceense TaxID=1686286 RepID=UPI00211C616C|nr:hypothetical protein [Corynebacterium phoceense]MCQ9334906.1 hypothetical protein [Corynebacterium phoceense]